LIRLFSEKDIEKQSVISLWQECFGDSKEYVEFFLDNCPHYTCIAYYADNKLVSMLFLLNGYLNSMECKYLYAACTSSEYRRQGIMEKLIDYSKEFALKCGACGIFLVPANEKLYSYYSKFGFISSFLKKEVKITEYNNKTCMTCNPSYDELISLKKELYNEIPAYNFDDKTIEYTVKEHLYNGGKFYFDKCNRIIVFYYENDTEIIIKEFLSGSADVNELINKYFINNNGKNIYISCPIVYNNQDNVENYTKCGMCFPLNDEMKNYLENNREIYAGMYLD
jgi:ribosomal protein S18 acetylase RimI-like enzyme